MKTVHAFLGSVAVGLILAACAPGSSIGEDEEAADRGDAVKLKGSCVDACGGKAKKGNCYCDELCSEYGDCCTDYADVCESSDFCGGFAGIACSEGETCVDDPSDDCDPLNGGADCGGICVPSPGEACGDVVCPEEHACVQCFGGPMCLPPDTYCAF